MLFGRKREERIRQEIDQVTDLINSVKDEIRQQNTLLEKQAEDIHKLQNVMGHLEEQHVKQSEMLRGIGQKDSEIEDVRERICNTERKLDQLRNATALYWKISIETRELPEYPQYDFGVWGMWSSYNYGAALTSYALGKLLEKEGYSFLMINMPATSGDEDMVEES